MICPGCARPEGVSDGAVWRALRVAADEMAEYISRRGGDRFPIGTPGVSPTWHVVEWRRCCAAYRRHSGDVERCELRREHDGDHESIYLRWPDVQSCDRAVIDDAQHWPVPCWTRTHAEAETWRVAGVSGRPWLDDAARQILATATGSELDNIAIHAGVVEQRAELQHEHISAGFRVVDMGPLVADGWAFADLRGVTAWPGAEPRRWQSDPEGSAAARAFAAFAISVSRWQPPPGPADHAREAAAQIGHWLTWPARVWRERQAARARLHAVNVTMALAAGHLGVGTSGLPVDEEGE